MSKSTRRLVFVTCLVALIAVPTELLLLRALSTPDQAAAVREWAQSLSSDELRTEVDRVGAYPVLYRRELMRAATPAVRARVWQSHFNAYLEHRAGLDVNAVGLIKSLQGMLTAEFFDAAPPDTRETAVELARQIAQMIGPDDAVFLMQQLGPADGTFASYEPIVMKMSQTLREWFVPSAQGGTCDCLPDWGCYNPGDTCEGGNICSPGQDWPQCGWVWSEGCSGICLAGW